VGNLPPEEEAEAEADGVVGPDDEGVPVVVILNTNPKE